MVDSDPETKLGDIFEVQPLHKVPNYTDECCHLINSEWKRTHTARLRTVQHSCDGFPTNLILLKKSENPQVLGHCRISKFSPTAAVVFLESVVIHPDHRGRGLGTFLMKETESYVLSKGIEWIYLSTEEQELFYEKLGYATCQPINIYGSPLYFNPDHEGDEIFEGLEECMNDLDEIIRSEGTGSLVTKNTVPPPPPPPPPPLPTNTQRFLYAKPTFMRKKLVPSK